MSKALKRHILILAAYTVITLIMTWPVVANLTTHIAGSGGDPWQTLWRFETKWQNFPQSFIDDILGSGEPRLANLSVWPWMPIHALLGEPLGYNIIWLLSFILSGYGMYLLAGRSIAPPYEGGVVALGDRGGYWREVAAFLAGLYYMFLPFHVAHAHGHFGAMQMQWLPFIILAALYFFHRPTWLNTIILAALISIQAWTEHHYALWLAVLAVFAFFYRRPKMKMKVSGTFIILVAALLLLGIILPYLPTVRLAQIDTANLSLGQEQTIRFSADPFAYIIPSSQHLLWGKLAEYLFTDSYTGNFSEATQFLGVVPILLLIFFHQLVPVKQKKFWLWVGAIFFIISLGPRLHILGRVTNIPLPWAIVDSWPVASAIRTIARAGVMVNLASSIFLAWVLTTQLKRPISAYAVGAVILLEFLFLPMPMQGAQLSPVYAAIQDLPGRSLIEIPAATNYTIASRALYASTMHGKQVLGNIALERGATNDQQIDLRSVPGLRHILYGGTNRLLLDRPENDGRPMTEAFTESALTYDAYAILIHTDSISPRQQDALTHFFEERLHLKPQQYSDATLYTFAP